MRARFAVSAVSAAAHLDASTGLLLQKTSRRCESIAKIVKIFYDWATDWTERVGFPASAYDVLDERIGSPEPQFAWDGSDCVPAAPAVDSLTPTCTGGGAV